MRNPARIYPLLNEIGDLWIKHPDLRFGQLVEIIMSDTSIPLFVIEEDDFEKAIKRFKKKINKPVTHRGTK